MRYPTVSLSLFSPLGLGAVFAVVFATSAPAQKSVTIPAKSASTLEKSPDTGPAPAAAAPVVPLTSPFSGKSNVSRVSVPAPQPGGGSITTQATPVADPVMKGTATAIERVESPKAPLDVTTIKRLSELRRELNIAESAVRARISLPANELFEAQSSTTIDPLAVPALNKIAEFLERTLKKEVTVKPFYIPGEEGAKEQAWSRSLALLEWLKENSSLSPDHLTASSPEPLDKPAPKANATSIGETEYVSRIELNIE